MTDATLYWAALLGTMLAVLAAARLRTRAKQLRVAVQDSPPRHGVQFKFKTTRGVSTGAMGVLALSLGLMALLNMSPASTLWSQDLTVSSSVTTHGDFGQVQGLCNYGISFAGATVNTSSGKTVYTYSFTGGGGGCKAISYVALPACFNPEKTPFNGPGYYYISSGLVVDTTQPSGWSYSPQNGGPFGKRVKWNAASSQGNGPFTLTFSFTLPGAGHPMVDVQAQVHAGGGSQPVAGGTVQFPQPVQCNPPPQCDGISLIKVFYGTANDDVITGTDFNDLIVGYGGNDKLTGGKGNDCIVGGAGNDKLYGGKGNDRVLGEAGDDKLYGEDGNDKLYGGDNSDYCAGGPGSDTIDGCEGSSTVNGLQGTSINMGEASPASLQSNTLPSQTATPTATPSATPTPTSTPRVQAQSNPALPTGPGLIVITPPSLPTLSPRITRTPTATRTPVTGRTQPTRTPVASATPTATGTAIPTATSTATGTAIPTATSTPSATPTRTATAVPTQTVTGTPPAGTTAVRNRLTWSPTTGAVSYNVYRAELLGGGPDGEYELVGNSNKPTFDDVKTEEKKTYYYVVTAVFSEDDESDASAELRLETAAKPSLTPVAPANQPSAPAQPSSPTATPTRTPVPSRSTPPPPPVGAPIRLSPTATLPNVVQPPIVGTPVGGPVFRTPGPIRTPTPRR